MGGRRGVGRWLQVHFRDRRLEMGARVAHGKGESMAKKRRGQRMQRWNGRGCCREQG